MQEYLGSYVVDEKGVFVFQEGVLPMAMRNGFWIILDELNLGKHYHIEESNGKNSSKIRFKNCEIY